MLDKERANVQRVLPNVPVNLLYVGPDVDSVQLDKIVSRARKYKSVLDKAEVIAVSNRLASLGRDGIPIRRGSTEPRPGAAPALAQQE